MKYRTYPEYKSVKHPWIMQLPAHWQFKQLKYLASCFPSNVDKITKEGEQPVLLCNYTDVYYNEVISSELNFMLASATDEQLKKFTLKKNDVIITKDSEDPNDIAVPAVVEEDLEGVVCGYHLSMVRSKKWNNGRFLKRVFDSKYARSVFATTCNGLTRYGLGSYAIDNAFFPQPPLVEQTQIGDFLDRETAKIDTLIDKQQQLIKLLQEKRQAVISHAVTKGLNPDVKMKDSGVDWLGDVPTHWKGEALKRLFKLEKRQDIENHEVLSVYRDYGVILKSSRDDNYNKTPENTSAYQLVEIGDLVINKMKAWQGSMGISNYVGITSPDYVVYTAIHNEHDKFLHYYLRASHMPDVYRSISNGIRPSQWRLETEKFEHLVIFLPSKKEQRAIAEYLNEQSNYVDELIQKAELAIELIIERRTALISAAVTGRIDVRNAA